MSDPSQVPRNPAGGRRALVAALYLTALAGCASRFGGHYSLRVVDDLSLDACPSMAWILELERIDIEVDRDSVTFGGRLGKLLERHVGTPSLPIQHKSEFVLDAGIAGPQRSSRGCTFEPTAEFHLIRPPSRLRWDGTFKVTASIPWEDTCTTCEIAVSLHAPRR